MSEGRTMTLRRQLFRSHLLVMLVTVGILVVVAAVGLAAMAALGIDVQRGTGESGHNDDRPPVPFALLVPLGAALLGASLISWSVARRLAAPIEAARKATHQLVSGRYDVRVEGGDVAELAELADDVNRLASTLESTERRRLRLLGDVAHELRNPLATIEASMEALMDGVVAPDDETFARVAREAARLRRLAGDLSELSAVSEPVSGLRDPVDLGELLQSVSEHLAPQAAAKELELYVIAEQSNPVVLGDRDRLVQVFTNVIGNAIQYTDRGSVTITLDASDDHSELITSVADTGRGLDAADQERIFERFYRVATDSEGTGVGLAIAKRLVEAHGGSIGATSDGVGRGATVTVRLPVANG